MNEQQEQLYKLIDSYIDDLVLLEVYIISLETLSNFMKTDGVPTDFDCFILLIEKAFMHYIATGLCKLFEKKSDRFSLYTLIREAKEAGQLEAAQLSPIEKTLQQVENKTSEVYHCHEKVKIFRNKLSAHINFELTKTNQRTSLNFSDQDARLLLRFADEIIVMLCSTCFPLQSFHSVTEYARLSEAKQTEKILGLIRDNTSGRG